MEKNVKKIKCKKKDFFKSKIFGENHPPTRHIKIQVIDFDPNNKSFCCKKKLFSTNLERVLRRIKSPRTCY